MSVEISVGQQTDLKALSYHVKGPEKGSRGVARNRRCEWTCAQWEAKINSFKGTAKSVKFMGTWQEPVERILSTRSTIKKVDGLARTTRVKASLALAMARASKTKEQENGGVRGPGGAVNCESRDPGV